MPFLESRVMDTVLTRLHFTESHEFVLPEAGRPASDSLDNGGFLSVETPVTRDTVRRLPALPPVQRTVESLARPSG
jgi:hypothetical protein